MGSSAENGSGVDYLLLGFIQFFGKYCICSYRFFDLYMQ